MSRMIVLNKKATVKVPVLSNQNPSFGKPYVNKLKSTPQPSNFPHKGRFQSRKFTNQQYINKNISTKPAKEIKPDNQPHLTVPSPLPTIVHGVQIPQSNTPIPSPFQPKVTSSPQLSAESEPKAPPSPSKKRPCESTATLQEAKCQKVESLVEMVDTSLWLSCPITIVPKIDWGCVFGEEVTKLCGISWETDDSALLVSHPLNEEEIKFVNELYSL